jgi:hypothetical protein
MCLSSGRWWLARSMSLSCGSFLHPLWTLRGPRRTPFALSWIRAVGRGAFSTSWSGRGTVQRRGAGFRWRTCWTLPCCGSSTVSVQIALRLALRVVSEAGVGTLLEQRVKGGYCHDFRRSRVLSLFGRRSVVCVACLLAIIDPLFIFHVFCLVFPHTWFQFPQSFVVYLTLCSPHVFVLDCLL